MQKLNIEHSSQNRRRCRPTFNVGDKGKPGRLLAELLLYVITIKLQFPTNYFEFLSSTLRDLQNMSPTYAPYPPLDNCPPGVQPHICVNGFSFCFRHGEEHCIRCPFEFRYMNNLIIQDDLEEIISERLSDVRRMLVFSFIASPTLFFFFFCRSASL